MRKKEKALDNYEKDIMSYIEKNELIEVVNQAAEIERMMRYVFNKEQKR